MKPSSPTYCVSPTSFWFINNFIITILFSLIQLKLTETHLPWFRFRNPTLHHFVYIPTKESPVNLFNWKASQRKVFEDPMCQIKYELIVEKATEFDKLPQQLNIFHIKYSIKLPTKALVPDVYAPFWHFFPFGIVECEAKGDAINRNESDVKKRVVHSIFPFNIMLDDEFDIEKFRKPYVVRRLSNNSQRSCCTKVSIY